MFARWPIRSRKDPNSLATAEQHPGESTVLIVSYSFKTEMRTRCFRVNHQGEPELVPCLKPGTLRKAGLGTAIKTATTAVGIKPCGGCERRAAQLDAATPGWIAGLLGRLRRAFP